MGPALNTPVLRAQHISKRFGGTLALDDVGIEVAGGEVHGLLGHNGSGKSTLIKILAGYHAPEPGGRIEIGGRDVRLPLAPGRFRALGMAFVHQDLGLIGALTVVENLRVGRMARGMLWPISWREETRHVAALLEEFGIDCDPMAQVESLEPWQRPLLGIVRAVDEMRTLRGGRSDGHGILVLDEPTASLGGTDVEQLFEVVRRVKAQGTGVLFVSHDLDEVLGITDRVTVLRDGRVAGFRPTAALTKQALTEMIVGRPVSDTAAALSAVASGPGAAVDDLRGAAVKNVSLIVGGGEIVGLTGLAGSGYAELGAMLVGAVPVRGGHLRLRGRSFDLTAMTPAAAIEAGIAYLPGERLREGCFAELTLNENVTLPVLSRFFRAGHLRLRALRAHSADLCMRFDVHPADPGLPLQALSGGNQQKVLLAKWLQLQPRLLILQEPTQGVDVGAREQIFTMIRACAADGGAVLCLSSDHEQLAALCRRVLVFRQGRISAELTGPDVSKERMAYECFGTDFAARQDAR